MVALTKIRVTVSEEMSVPTSQSKWRHVLEHWDFQPEVPLLCLWSPKTKPCVPFFKAEMSLASRRNPR
jgi:hypothetical protein